MGVLLCSSGLKAILRDYLCQLAVLTHITYEFTQPIR